MAETRKVIIEIVQKQESTSQILEQIPNSEESQAKGKQQESLLSNVIVNQAFNTAKNAIISAASASFSRYLNLSEDYMAENFVSNAKTTISKISSLGASVFAGAKLGSAGGVVGAGIGAVIGFAGWGVSEVINYQTRMSSYHRALNASNYQVDLTRQRAGLYNESKGTEN